PIPLSDPHTCSSSLSLHDALPILPPPSPEILLCAFVALLTVWLKDGKCHLDRAVQPPAKLRRPAAEPWITSGSTPEAKPGCWPSDPRASAPSRIVRQVRPS